MTFRIANCSGFFGDRHSAALEMVQGGQIDVLTGDFLAELTMYILAKTKERSKGYARSGLAQIEEVLPLCLDRGIKIVTNAGGLNPDAFLTDLHEVAEKFGISFVGALVKGDDIAQRLTVLRDSGERFSHIESGDPLDPVSRVVSANAYLGASGIAEGLRAGADVVVTGRVSDASLVVGPSIWRYDWDTSDIDSIASAVVAGHIIECGCQATGGNYSHFYDLREVRRMGFPLVEIESDGSFVVTKHDGTGGAVTKGTVTAQLLYEIASPKYMSPDAVAHFDTIQLQDEGETRIKVTGVKGSPPPPNYKVAVNIEGGFRNSMTLVLYGPDIEAKAKMAIDVIYDLIGSDYSETNTELFGDLSGHSGALLRISVSGPDELQVGQAFSRGVIESVLATYPGAFATSAPASAQAVALYWPTTVSCDQIDEVVVVGDHKIQLQNSRLRKNPSMPSSTNGSDSTTNRNGVTVMIGDLVGGRSGDKGGNANLGLWATTKEVFMWMRENLGVLKLKELLPEVRDFDCERFILENLLAVNFVIHGLLGAGVASNLLLDSQAKGLAERLRVREVLVDKDIAFLPSVKKRIDRRKVMQATPSLESH